MFSKIFEKNDEIRSNPFVFEKNNLKKDVIKSEYDVKMESILILCKKKNPLVQKQMNIINPVNEVSSIGV